MTIQSLDGFDLDAIENAIDSGAGKPVIFQIIAKAANLPKPIIALAYLKISKMSDQELRDHARQAIEIIRAMQSGADLDPVLAKHNLDPALKTIIQNYAQKFNQQDKN